MVPTFDIEAVQWTQPIAVGFFDGREYHEFLKINEECDVIWEFLKFIKKYEGIKVYAHNAAGYDNKFILDSLTKHDQIVRFVAGLGALIWIGPNISFEDSYLLLSRKLSVCCEALGVSQKLEWRHDETKNPWEMQPILGSFSEYLKRDCIALSEVLDSFTEKLLTNFGITPSSTLALTAIKAFNKRFYPVRKIASNVEFETFIRAATYGGRNEVYKRYGENINFYDVKRMFMSCYDTPVPVGRMRWRSPNIDKGTLAEAIVKVPDASIGPLPYRFNGRLIFPIGEFRGWWDMVELRYAAQLGVDIKLIRQLECDEKPILKSFCEFVNKLSENSNLDMGRIWKLFGLRLSGKFGQHRIRTEIKHVKDIKENEYNPMDKNEIYHEVTSSLASFKSPYIKPAINMRIRAEAKVRHLEKLLEAQDVYYCDTDSVYTTVELPTGNHIGDLKLVEFAVRAYFVGSKFYGYVNSSEILKQKTAGYRDYQLTEYDFKRVLKGEEIPCTFSRIENWKEILKGRGVNLVKHSFTFRQPNFSNRILGEIETSPIKLIDGKAEEIPSIR